MAAQGAPKGDGRGQFEHGGELVFIEKSTDGLGAAGEDAVDAGRVTRSTPVELQDGEEGEQGDRPEQGVEENMAGAFGGQDLRGQKEGEGETEPVEGGASGKPGGGGVVRQELERGP